MVNFAELMEQAEGSFEPLPVGSYDVEVIESSATTTSNDKDMFKLTFAVAGGPHNGRKLWTNLVISPESPVALGIFFQQMKAFGLLEFLGQNPPMADIAAAFMGRKVTVTIKHKEWDGSIREEVKGIKPLAGHQNPTVVASPSAIPSPGAPAGGGSAAPGVPSGLPF